MCEQVELPRYIMANLQTLYRVCEIFSVNS